MDYQHRYVRMNLLGVFTLVNHEQAISLSASVNRPLKETIHSAHTSSKSKDPLIFLPRYVQCEWSIRVILYYVGYVHTD